MLHRKAKSHLVLNLIGQQEIVPQRPGLAGRQLAEISVHKRSGLYRN